MSKIENHYSIDYFEKYQKKIGEFGGKANKFKFDKYININDIVLDFGCGGGFLLQNLNCKEKIGVEINEVARNFCNNNGIKCFESINYVDDESIDVIISNHCLEHAIGPVELIQNMYPKLKKGGRIILVVPHDSYKISWKANDINNHLYSFSPMNLGNILQGCNFKNIQSGVLLHKWPPKYQLIENLFGYKVFNFLCLIYGRINKRWVQVRASGIK
jgi:SAM-dependent methyltransferase